jgi:hypothetical protein
LDVVDAAIEPLSAARSRTTVLASGAPAAFAVDPETDAGLAGGCAAANADPTPEREITRVNAKTERTETPPRRTRALHEHTNR